MPPLKVYPFDSVGVIVDTDPSISEPCQLTKSQNAIPEPLGAIGALRKRPGLKKFNAAAGDGKVMGAHGIPFFLGSAGPDFDNPFLDLDFTPSDYTAPEFVGDEVLGATFGDDSEFFEFDWTLTDTEDAEEPPEGEVPLELTEDPAEQEAVEGSQMVPLIILGSGTDWYIGFNETLSEHVDNSVDYPNPKSLLFPITSLRGDAPLADWATGGSTMVLRGRPMINLNGSLYYAEDGA